MKRFFMFIIMCSLVLSTLSINVFCAESEIVAGDLNSDGAVDPKDVTYARRYLSGGLDQDFNLDAFDVNADGNLNARDVTAIRRYVAEGWEVELILPSQMKAKYINEVFNLVNELRISEGLNPYEYYDEGQIAADIRANEIVKSFSHTRPDGRNAYSIMDDCDINYWSFGENIAEGFGTPAEVVEAWMNSDGHRENILSNYYDYIIIGFYENHWVQLFLYF